MTMIARHSVYAGKSFAENYNYAAYHYIMYGLIQNQSENFDEKHTQNIFLTNMNHSRKIICEVDPENNSTNATDSEKYKNGGLIHAIAQVIFKLYFDKGACISQYYDSSTQSYGSSNSINDTSILLQDNLLMMLEMFHILGDKW